MDQNKDNYFQTEHLNAALAGRTARGGLVTIVSHGLKFALSIVATAIMARLLTPQDYGLIAMAAVILNFVSMFKDLGLSFATVQRPEITDSQISTLFWVNVALSAAVLVVAVVIAPGVSWFYGEPRLTMITIVIALGFLFSGLTVQHEALLRRQMKFFALSAIALLSMISGYSVGILLAWYGFGYWALVFSQLALLLAGAIGVWTACGWRPGLPKRNAGVGSMLTFGGNITGYAVVNYFSKNSDNLLIGKFYGAQPLGLYNKAAQLLVLPTDQIDEPLSSVAIPALSRLIDSPERYRQAYLRIVEKVLMLIMPTIALMIATSDWLVLIVLGPQWGEAARIFVFMAIAGLFTPLVNTVGWLFISQGRAQHMLYWSLINAPISVLAIVAGLPWGPMGVAASYSLAKVLVLNPIMFWLVGRDGPVRTVDLFRAMGPFVLASTCALMTCVGVRQVWVFTNPLLGLIACAGITAIISLFILVLIPSGRSALMDIKHSALLLRRVKEGPELLAQEPLLRPFDIESER